jgi:hypothetical protein
MSSRACTGEPPVLARSAGESVVHGVPQEEFRYLQALEDAISYRTGRSAEPCADCSAAAGGKCNDHGRDIDLIGEYQAASRQCAERIQAGVQPSAPTLR